MSQIHKVIVLNKSLKIFDFTPLQLLQMLLALVISIFAGSKMPADWKINHIPAGFLTGLLIFCSALVFVKMSEVKPWTWWRNLILYRLGLVPTTFIPKPEQGQIYPDPNIIEMKKRSQQDYYVEAE